MFLMATVRFRTSSARLGTSSTAPLRSTKTRRPPQLTITSVMAGSRSKSSIERRNGRMRSRLPLRPALQVIEVAGLHVQVVRLQIAELWRRRMTPSYGSTTAWAFCSSVNTRGGKMCSYVGA